MDFIVFSPLSPLTCCLLFPREWHVEYFICTFLFGHSNEFPPRSGSHHRPPMWAWHIQAICSRFAVICISANVIFMTLCVCLCGSVSVWSWLVSLSSCHTNSYIVPQLLHACKLIFKALVHIPRLKSTKRFITEWGADQSILYWPKVVWPCG